MCAGEKCFAVGNIADPLFNFYAETGSALELYKALQKDQLVLVLGHRQAGKSTVALQAAQMGISDNFLIAYCSLSLLIVSDAATHSLCIPDRVIN